MLLRCLGHRKPPEQHQCAFYKSLEPFSKRFSFSWCFDYGSEECRCCHCVSYSESKDHSIRFTSFSSVSKHSVTLCIVGRSRVFQEETTLIRIERVHLVLIFQWSFHLRGQLDPNRDRKMLPTAWQSSVFFFSLILFFSFIRHPSVHNNHDSTSVCSVFILYLFSNKTDNRGELCWS